MNKALKGFMKAPFTSQLGMVVVMVYAFVALTAPLLAPFGETEIVGDQYEPWGSVFLLGTDNIGRDMLTRLIYGARNTVGIAFVITSLAFVIGGFTGMLAATLGGWIDQILSRIVDVLMAIPGLVFVLLVLSFFGTAIPVLIIVSLFSNRRVFFV